MKGYPLLLTLLLAPSALAGMLEFKNGDRLAGELVSMDADNVLWQSDSLGKLTIPKAKVDNLDSSQLVKLDGHEDACALVGMEGSRVRFSCAEGDTGDVPLLTLNKVEPYEDYLAGSASFTGKLSLSGYQVRGNKREEALLFDASAEYRRGDYRHAGRAQYDALTKEPLPSQSRWLGEYQLEWFFAERWFWTNTLTYSADEAKLIDRRYQLGSGIGYQFWENDVTALSLRAGLSYVDDYYLATEPPAADFVPRDNRGAWTAGLNYRYHFPFGADFVHVDRYTQSGENSDDWQWEADTGFSMPIVGGLYSELKHELDYDNEPQAGTKRTDNRFTLGVGYRW